MFPTINKKETGVNLRRIMDMRGVKPKDIQEYLGFGCVQSVYRWLDGVSMPTVDGNFNIEATSRGEILVIFTDTYNKRSDVIKVTLNKLKVFLCQPSLYVGIPSETDVMLFQRQDI